MKVLVTGGNGFIGSHVIEYLTKVNEHADEKFEIVSLDNHSPVFPFNGIYEDIRGDIRNRKLVYELISQVDKVIHMAGILGTAETIEALEETAGTNIMGSINVFEAVRDMKKRCVYITVGNDWMNPYSLTKHTSAKIAQMINRWQGGKIIVVRGLNAYGPRQKAYPVRKVFPTFALSAIMGIPLQVYSSGNMIVDLVHVRDLARGLVQAMLAPENPEIYDHILDLGTERKTEVLWLAKFILKQVYNEIPENGIKHIDMRLGEPKDSVTLGDISNSSKYIDYTPSIPIEEGIPETIQWYKDNVQLFSKFTEILCR